MMKREKEILEDLITDYDEYIYIETNFRYGFGKNFREMAILNFDSTCLILV